MEVNTWITICLGVVFPFVGWIFNSLITNKINEVNKRVDEAELQRKSDRELYLRRLDDVKKDMEDHYVRKDLYEQAMKFYNEHNDEKFKSLLAIMNTQFENVEKSIEEVKKLIKQGG